MDEDANLNPNPSPQEPSPSEDGEANSRLAADELSARYERYRVERKRRRNRQLELTLWILLAVGSYGAQLWISWNLYLAPTLAKVVSASTPALLVAVLLMLFPLVFHLIFQAFPLELVRENRIRENRIREQGAPEIARRDQLEAQPLITTLEVPPASPPDVGTLWKNMADASGRIAEKIYTRAGVYLLFGVLIAFSGLGFFYLQSQATLRSGGAEANVLGLHAEANSTAASKTLAETVASMAPGLVGRIGVLFFIELVAFFFLRQYRAAMDEYRYFEAIKRRREENLALVTMFSHGKGDRIDFAPFVEKCSLYSDSPKLAAGETTEILETRKLTKDEMALFEKMIDAVTKAKS